MTWGDPAPGIHFRDQGRTPRPGSTPVTRRELIERTRQLIAEGERLDASPSLGALRLWLKLSDDLLAAAWGRMDRYHLSWLMVGRPEAPKGRRLRPDEEADYVREVARQKNAALRMSLDAVDRQGMPFLGETEALSQPGRRQAKSRVQRTSAHTKPGSVGGSTPRTSASTQRADEPGKREANTSG